MAHINEHFLKLKAGYLFPEIARRVTKFCEANPEADVIKLGIGDVTEPLPPAVVETMHQALDEMAVRETFHGYGPEQGYEFLRNAIVENMYTNRGVNLEADEIFVSDGSKCDTGNILDVFGAGNTVAVLDPVYPVYVDTNVMTGRTGPADESGRYQGLLYIPVTAENEFVPEVPNEPVDLIYLCYPNNPTGTVAGRETLSQWVNYAKEHDAVIFYDAAYEAYITQPEIPHSIYEIEGAREVAIEFGSFSKSAGFTGTRCAWTVVPKELTGQTSSGERVDVHRLWNRRHSTKFNGVSYVVQRGAEAVFSPKGQQQVKQLIDFYLTNAKLLREGLETAGITVYGGVNAPYIWLKTPESSSRPPDGTLDTSQRPNRKRGPAEPSGPTDRGMSSWQFFDHLLQNAHLVGTPGSGFGASGEGYFRLSAFNNRENIEQAVARIQRLMA